jgi:riboflavin synthase alpha subunit
LVSNMSAGLSKLANHFGLQKPSKELLQKYHAFEKRRLLNSEGSTEDGYLFSGIVNGIGKVGNVSFKGARRIAEVTTTFPLGYIDGVSRIFHSGIDCGIEKLRSHEGKARWDVEIPDKNLGAHWEFGTHLNLERPIHMGDGAGGQRVFGDQVESVEIIDIRPHGNIKTISFLGSKPAPKVGNALIIEGVALTVATSNGPEFSINILPETEERTTISSWQFGDTVAVERDILCQIRIPPPIPEV